MHRYSAPPRRRHTPSSRVFFTPPCPSVSPASSAARDTDNPSRTASDLLWLPPTACISVGISGSGRSTSSGLRLRRRGSCNRRRLCRSCCRCFRSLSPRESVPRGHAHPSQHNNENQNPAKNSRHILNYSCPTSSTANPNRCLLDKALLQKYAPDGVSQTQLRQADRKQIIYNEDLADQVQAYPHKIEDFARNTPG